MGNRTAFLFVFFLALVSSNLVFAASAKQIACKFDINNLKFVGESFGGSTYCISASSDTEAKAACGPGTRYINPGNPDYSGNGGGSRESNSLGFYFCNTGRTKQEMCATAAAKYPALKYQWSPVGNAVHKDGMCQCEKDRTHAGLEDCSAPTVATAQNQCTGEGITTASNGECTCKDGFEIDKENTQESTVCKKVADKAKPSTPVTGVDPALQACVEKHEGIAKTCDEKSTEAKTTCDPKDTTNKEVVSAMQLPSQASDLYVASKAGTGMLTECLMAGALSNGSKLLMDKMKPTCEANNAACDANCGEDKVQKYEAECKPLYDKAMQGDAADPNKWGDEGNVVVNNNADYYTQHSNTIKTLQTRGTSVCSKDAKAKKSDLDGVLQGLMSAYQRGQRCACQVASVALPGATPTTCDTLPTAAQCLADPTLVGCPINQAIDVCTMGSPNYSAQGCTCQTTPTAQGCAQYAAQNAGNSGFAGLDIGNPTTSGGVGFGDSSGAGGGGDNINLSGARPDDVLPGAKPSASGAGFQGGGAGGGAGGGGGSAPTPGNDNAKKEDAEGDSKGLGGMFGAAKSFAGSLFGGPKAVDKTAATKDAFADGKFRPKNGLRSPGSEGVGGKNADIWQMMNERYNMVEDSFK